MYKGKIVFIYLFILINSVKLELLGLLQYIVQ